MESAPCPTCGAGRPTHPKQLNVDEAAAYSGFSVDQLRRAARKGADKGGVRATLLGARGPLSFTRPDLDAWIASLKPAHESLA